MAVTGHNQTKSVVSVKGMRKAGIYLWGDTEATWGDPLATWGNFGITPTNQTRTSTVSTFLVTDEGDHLVTDEEDYLCASIGGATVNQSKT